jgi:hypothetical protein
MSLFGAIGLLCCGTEIEKKAVDNESSGLFTNTASRAKRKFLTGWQWVI